MSERESQGDEVSAEALDAFDDEQLRTLMSAVRTQPDGSASVEERTLFLAWVHHAYTAGLLLNLVLDGQLAVSGFAGDEPRWASMEYANGRAAVAKAEQVIGEGQ